MPTLVTTIQCALRVDHISDPDPVSGEVFIGRQLPYPYHIAPDGSVLQQSLWQGNIAKLIGFQRNIEVQRVDLFWESFDYLAPHHAQGMYPVFVDYKGTMFSFETPVDTIKQWMAE